MEEEPERVAYLVRMCLKYGAVLDTLSSGIAILRIRHSAGLNAWGQRRFVDTEAAVRFASEQGIAFDTRE